MAYALWLLNGNSVSYRWVRGERSLYPSEHLLYYPQKPHFENLFWENKKWTIIFVHFEKTLGEIQNENTVFCIQSIMLRFSKFPEKPDCITFFNKF